MAEERTAHRGRVVVGHSLRVLLCAVFAYAGVIKLLDPTAFYLDLQTYRLFPETLSVGIVYFIPALEIMSAIGLWLRSYRLASAGILLGLMLAFTLIIIVSWLRGLDIACGCFGSAEMTTNYPYLLLRDSVLLIAVIILFFIEYTAKSTR